MGNISKYSFDHENIKIIDIEILNSNCPTIHLKSSDYELQDTNTEYLNLDFYRPD